MNSRWLHRWLVAALLPWCSAPALAEGVRILTPAGNLNFTTIQAAVDAAQDGDVLLVGGGVYPTFTIQDKSLFVIAVPGSLVEIQGTVDVRSLAAGRTVVLAGLSSRYAMTVFPSPPPGLRLSNNAGQVRIQSCNFRGPDGAGEYWNGQQFEGSVGGIGAELQNCLQVAFVASTLRGGDGAGHSRMQAAKGGGGGDGVNAQGSAIAFYDCQLLGGRGGTLDSDQGGPGGAGARVLGLGIFASGSSFRGGNGGSTYGMILGAPTWGGSGGPGLHVGLAQAQLLANNLAGGPGGFGANGGPNGQTGPATAGGGVFNSFAGAARKFSAGAAISGDQVSLPWTVTGTPGDRVFLANSSAPGWRVLTPVLPGILLLREPWLASAAPLGTLPVSGSLALSSPLGDVSAATYRRVSYLQGYVVDSAGAWVLGSPMHLVTIDRSAPPDCDGNGVNDFVDVIEGSDCNHNLVPDACDPDSNGNGIPDECEPLVYVDAAAPAGGNGTPGAPFRTIREGIAAAVDGDAVIVRDGLYVGPDNRGLSFLNKDIVVRSENGPANCILDCQGLGRGFDVSQVEPPTARIEGFTIRNGNAGPTDGGGILVSLLSRVTISNCVLRDCRAISGAGISLQGGAPTLVEGCTFLGNTAAAVAGSRGGGLEVRSLGSVIRDCTFTDNQTDGKGGGLFSHSTVVISNCKFLRNRAQSGGGLSAFAGGPLQPLQIQNCLFVGNVATADGGGVHCDSYFAGSAVRSSQVTIVQNTAARGGGFWMSDNATLTLANSILWDNSASLGAEIGSAQQGPPHVVNVSYCDVMRGANALYFPGSTLNWGAGNLDLDPRFADSRYRLAASSPCVDAGDNSAVPPDLADLDGDGNSTEPLPVDLDHAPRFADVPSAPDTGNGTAPLVDMGATERRP